MKSKNVAHILSQSALFGNLGLQGRQAVAKQIRTRTYSAGEIVVLTGELCRAVYLIARGKVRLHRMSSEGRQVVLRTIGAGQGFNIAPAMDGGDVLATASALTDALLYRIPVEAFRQIVRDDPQVTRALIEHLTGRVRQLCNTVENLAFHTVRTRLARFLLSRAKRDTSIARYTSQAELAAHIGTVRAVIGRALRSFSRRGLIRRERGRVVITDPEGLQREALLPTQNQLVKRFPSVEPTESKPRTKLRSVTMGAH
jgi:CRP-like cAMP-binding protein